MDYNTGFLMDFPGAEISRSTEVLRKAGFSVSETCHSRPSCFDFAARKKETVILMKVLADVGTLNSRDARELETISSSISASMLVIGSKGRNKPLEDDTVYSRHNVLTITPTTLENFVLHDTSPLMRANPGGCYVEIDGEIVKRKRQELSLSVGKLARMAGVSRRTLYGYERRMAKASVQTAYNLVRALGAPVAKPVKILEKAKPRSKCKVITKAKYVIGRNRLFFKIFRKFARCDVTAVSRAPFDFVLNIPQEKKSIIGGFVIGREEDLEMRIQEISSVSEIVGARAILLTHGEGLMNDNIPCFQYEDLAKSANPENLIVNTA